jgi:hypothetical protein
MVQYMNLAESLSTLSHPMADTISW